MNEKTHLIVLVLAVLGLVAHSAEQPLVRVGDSVDAVRNHLGEPRIEFPLSGQMIQDYGHCVVTSENGVVVSIQRREKTSTQDAPSESEESKAAAITKILLAKAEKGDVESQYQLAYRYQTGTGISPNPDECVRWYTVAAMQGHAASQHNLGVLYLSGKGVERDFEQAYTWGVLAAENGDETLTQALLPRLTSEQELAGRLRASRIRDGLEPLPYGSPDSSTSIAKKEFPPAHSSVE